MVPPDETLRSVSPETLETITVEFSDGIAERVTPKVVDPPSGTSRKYLVTNRISESLSTSDAVSKLSGNPGLEQVMVALSFPVFGSSAAERVTSWSTFQFPLSNTSVEPPVTERSESPDVRATVTVRAEPGSMES